MFSHFFAQTGPERGQKSMEFTEKSLQKSKIHLAPGRKTDIIKILPIKVRRRTMSKLLREIKLATIPFEPKSTSEIKNFK